MHYFHDSCILDSIFFQANLKCLIEGFYSIPLETSENLWFSNVFRGHRIEALITFFEALQINRVNGFDVNGKWLDFM